MAYWTDEGRCSDCDRRGCICPPGEGMNKMSGDPICGNCRGFHPSVYCPIAAQPQYFDPVMVRQQLPELFLTANPGADLTKDELVQVLTGYLKDAVFAQRFADCIDMIRRKNADYTQGQGQKDRIAAFRRIGGDIDVPMAKVWAIFAQKHWGAVMKFVKDGAVESEPIDGRINDLINYFVLLGAIVDDTEGK